MSNFWTPEDDATLRAEWAAGTPASEIVNKIPGRSYTAIMSHAQALGLGSRPRSKRRYIARPWLPEDDETMLAMHAGHASASAIGKALGRTPNAVNWRLMKLGAKQMSACKAKPKEPPRKVKLSCLRCQHPFISEDRKRNRVCNHCKSGNAWRSGGSFEVRI